MLMVVNASNREKIIDWLNSRLQHWMVGRSQERMVVLLDQTAETAMFALQGPKAVDVLAPIVEAGNRTHPPNIRVIRYYHYSDDCFDGIISRTGYTGEDGFEIICHARHALQVWEELFRAAEAAGGKVAGLGARDTLRLEAAMPLYGHELSEEINPIQAGLRFAVNLGDRQFVGRAALERFSADANQLIRVGFVLDGRRVPRQGCLVYEDTGRVGEVTSGTFSLTLEQPIAMAFVRPASAATGTRLNVDIRGTQHPATVVPLPFYERTKKD
jgi:aminomethyltransferase